MRTEIGDKIRAKLREASKGEPETWGFVAMFMEMIDEAEKETKEQKPEWIKVSDRLPNDDQIVLVWGCSTHPDLLIFRNGNFIDQYTDDEIMTGITHWQPLPEPPKD